MIVTNFDNSKLSEISSGAEAKIFLAEYVDKSNILKKNIIKKRIEKTYRISEIDEVLRKTRTKREYKILETLNNKASPERWQSVIALKTRENQQSNTLYMP